MDIINKTFAISGMTCMGCKAKVEHQLTAVIGVTGVEVGLETGEAYLTLSNRVGVSDLQEALSPKYKISEKKSTSGIPTKAKSSKLIQLKPLLLILVYISVTSILLHHKTWNWNSIMLDFMGLFYIVFSFFKMLDVKGFSNSFKRYDPLANKIPVYGLVYPFLETTLGLMLLFRFQVDIALIVTICILGLTTIGVLKTLISKTAIRCACLGTTLNLPMTEATLIENVIMIVMAVCLLFV